MLVEAATLQTYLQMYKTSLECQYTSAQLPQIEASNQESIINYLLAANRFAKSVK